jgi:hypothetical protein
VQASPSLLYGIAAASVVSLALSGYAAFGRRPAAASPAPGANAACACDDAALRRELAELKQALAARGDDARVSRLTARVEALEAKSGVAAPPSAEGADDPAVGPAPTASAAAARAGAPSFTSFEVPTPAIRVRQEPGGALAVTNTDPAMTGKHLTLKATAADGSTHDVHVIVPAPQQ